MPRVCVVGSANIDLTFRASTLPRPGQTVPGSSFATSAGGKGANQAVMAANLGADVAFLARVGADPFGDQLLRALDRPGLDLTGVRLGGGHPTGCACILVDDSARNCIVVVPGANALLSAEDVQQSRKAVTSADVLVAQCETPLEATREAFTLAREAGVRTILNPAPALPLPTDLYPLVDLLVPNETEAEALTGQSANSDEEATQTARILLARGPRAVVLTRGDRGALLLDAQGLCLVPAFAVTAVDPTGAGDAFIGALAVYLALGLPLERACLRASGAAALSVTRPGALSSFPTREEVERFLAEQGAEP